MRSIPAVKEDGNRLKFFVIAA